MSRTFLLLLALSLAAGAAQGEEKFQRKSGSWEVKRTSTLTREQTRVYQICIDQASDNALPQVAEIMTNERCETNKLLREGDKLIVDAVCSLRRPMTTATTHAVITGTFDSAYKIESKSTFDPPIRGKAESSAVVEGKWAGPCKPDQRPGDYILPYGVKVRANEPERSPEEKAAEKTAAEKAAAAAKPPKQKPKGNFMPVPTPK
jgi:hypothetical protein